MSGDHKKRKRSGEDGAKTKKRKVAVDEPASVQITKVVIPQVSPPIIMENNGFQLPESVDFTTYTKKPKGKRRKGGMPERGDLLLHTTVGNMSYTAREELAGTEAHLNHFVCIYDPETGEVTAIQARKMTLRGTVLSQQALPAALTPKGARKTALDLKNELGQTFGTKKAKKAIQSLTENAISTRKPGEDPSSPQKLGAEEKAIMAELQEKTSQMATQEELQAAANLAKPLPRGNYDAKDIQDVYRPSEIIGAEVLNAIPVMAWQQAANAGEEVQFTSRYVAHRFMQVASHTDVVPRLRLLRYLYWLIQFWQTATQGKGRGTKRVPHKDKLKVILQDIPDIVIDTIRRKFTEAGTMNTFHQQLLMTHCCVFACILDGFEVNTLDLKEDLKLEQKQIGQYFMELGARLRVSKAGGRTEQIAKLSLPLEFPKMRQQQRRR